jgi:hypothetical protein
MRTSVPFNLNRIPSTFIISWQIPKLVIIEKLNPITGKIKKEDFNVLLPEN